MDTKLQELEGQVAALTEQVAELEATVVSQRERIVELQSPIQVEGGPNDRTLGAGYVMANSFSTPNLVPVIRTEATRPATIPMNERTFRQNRRQAFLQRMYEEGTYSAYMSARLLRAEGLGELNTGRSPLPLTEL